MRVGQRAGVELAERGHEALPAVQEQHDVRQPRRPSGTPVRCSLMSVNPRSPERRHAGAAPRPSRFSISRTARSRLVGPDHRAAVRQRGQRQQRAVAAVERVQVHVRRGSWRGPAAGDGAQRLRPAGARGAGDHQVAEGRQVDRRWCGGPAGPAGRRSRTGAGSSPSRDSRRGGSRSSRVIDSVRAGSHGLCCGGMPSCSVRLDGRVHQHREVGQQVVVVGLGGPRDAPAPGGPAPPSRRWR